MKPGEPQESPVICLLVSLRTTELENRGYPEISEKKQAKVEAERPINNKKSKRCKEIVAKQCLRFSSGSHYRCLWDTGTSL